MIRPSSCAPFAVASILIFGPAASAAPETTAPSSPPGYDAALAERLGADEHGMRSYVLVVLKTGPTRVADGPERDAMFRGHFENMQRLSQEGVLVHAGPLDGVDGWRGLFLFAMADIEEAKKHVATDPVIQKGEMVAEYHKHSGSAALMLVPETHDKVMKKSS
jgi:uncharacterized protein YciI